MKRTTYVILGVLLALLAGMSATIIYWGTHSGDNSERVIRLEGERRERLLPACKVVRFQADEVLRKYDDNAEQAYYFRLHNMHLEVTPADAATGSFSYAADIEEFLDFQTHGDTLDVLLSFPPEKLREKMPQGEMPSYFILETTPFYLRLPEGVEQLTGNMFYAVELMDLRHDSLAIDFSEDSGTVFVRNSRFRALSASSSQLCLLSGSVDHLHLDLDKLRGFEMEADSFHIDTEYLSGSYGVTFSADARECRRILWNPLTEDAWLNLEVKKQSEILLRNEQ